MVLAVLLVKEICDLQRVAVFTARGRIDMQQLRHLPCSGPLVELQGKRRTTYKSRTVNKVSGHTERRGGRPINCLRYKGCLRAAPCSRSHAILGHQPHRLTATSNATTVVSCLERSLQ